MKPIISLKDLNIVYDLGKSNETQAVTDVTLDILPGEYVIFFGPSGCGKSTLLYAIAGLQPPTKGDVFVDGVNLKDVNPSELIKFYRKTIGMIFQAYQLIPQLSAEDNIVLPSLFSGGGRNESKEKAKGVIERFGITEFADRRPQRMSGGQQQRTAIARSLVNDPNIILADEPVGNLDSKNAKIVLDLLSSINQTEKKTVIYVTHNPRDLHYAHRVFHMQDGKIERVVVNTDHAGADQISEIDRLAQVYPYLSELRLQAKLILNHFIAPYDIAIQEKIEEVIGRYLKKEINNDDFYKLLNDSGDGVGLYSQKAKDLSGRVEALVKEIEEVRKQESAVSNVEGRAISIRKYLLDEYTGSLSYEQVERIGHFLRERLRGTLSAQDLRIVFDKPTSEGGVGLNARTASRFGREVEIILARPADQ